VTALDAILIAGPTASGKSALALALAEATGGLVVNTDSMQVYRDLRIVTARPTPDEEARVPHRLYGHVDAATNYSVGHYVTEARAVVARAQAESRLPILCGGTGLYFKALTRGLSDIPPVPDDVRAAVRDRLDRLGPEALHAELATLAPEEAARLNPRDRLRVARALEVMLATGRPPTAWHTVAEPPTIDPRRAVKVFLAPDREALYARIDARFAAMMDAGALEEVRALAARRLDPLLPAMRAHGVPGLIAFLGGRITREEAVARAQADTRHYAKRQFTWFRHQMPDWTWITPDPSVPERARDAVLACVRAPAPWG
jgi:tRNA dimethylallyltransferase